MATLYSYTGPRDVTRSGQQCIPWLEVANNQGIYLFQINGGELVMGVDERDLISGLTVEELEGMGNKCR